MRLIFTLHTYAQLAELPTHYTFVKILIPQSTHTLDNVKSDPDE